MSDWESEGKFLRELRHETKLSIFKIGKMADITGNYLSLIERGKGMPSDKILSNLAQIYDIEPVILFNLYGKTLLPANKQSKYYDLLCRIREHVNKENVLSIEQKEEFMKKLYLAVEEIEEN